MMETAGGYIYLHNLRMHGLHGVMEQERVVGNDYRINIRLHCPLGEAAESDDLRQTVNYAEACEVVRAAMDQPSQLLEHVAWRMAKALFAAFPQLVKADIDICKLNPPMGADLEGAGVSLSFSNSDTL